MGTKRTIIVGISGPSSSGKTTLARVLRSTLLEAGHHAFILHEDDFYVTDTEIPIHEETGLQDWDCLEAIDEQAFQSALMYIREHGESPPALHSKEDQNSIGKVNIQQKTLENIQSRAKALAIPEGSTIAIIDGFLLFTPSLKPVYDLMQVRIFLPLTRDLMIKRRAARSGYVTLEGFWQDPPGYVEKVVWPNYATDHAYLFCEGDVEGQLKDDQVKQLQLQVAPASAMRDMNVCLEWAWDVLERHSTKL